jgi:hypothetical protein
MTKPYTLKKLSAPKTVNVWGVYDKKTFVASVLKVGANWMPTLAGGQHLPRGFPTRWAAADYVWGYLHKGKKNPAKVVLPVKVGQQKTFTARGKKAVVKKKKAGSYVLSVEGVTQRKRWGNAAEIKKDISHFLAYGTLAGPSGPRLNPKPKKKAPAKKKAAPKKASIRIVKLKAGGYSISGKDKLGKPIKMRSEKKSTANAVKRLVVEKGYTTAQLRSLTKSAKALRPFVKNPGKVWFPESPPCCKKVRKKTPVQLRKKKKKAPAKAKKNPAKKKSYARVTKLFKELVARIGKKTPKAKDPLKKVGLVVKAGIHDTPRHYGIYIPSQNLVGVAPEIVFLPDSAIRGVLLHELGHALIDQGVYAKPKKRGYYATERRADVVAKAASGLTVYYDKNHIQRAGAGASGLKVRPKSLR